MAGKTITLPDGNRATLPEREICLEPPAGAILRIFQTDDYGVAVKAPGLGIVLPEGATVQIPKGETLTLKNFGTQLPIKTIVVWPGAKDAVNPERQTPVRTTEGFVLFWLPDGGSFGLTGGGSIDWQPKAV